MPEPVNDFLQEKKCVFIVRLHGDPPSEGDALKVVKIPDDCEGDHKGCVLELPPWLYILHTTPPSYNTWSDDTDTLLESLEVGTLTPESKIKLAAALFTCQLQSDVAVEYEHVDLTKPTPIITQLFRYGQLYEPRSFIYNYNLHYEENSKILKLNKGRDPTLIKKMHCFCMNSQTPCGLGACCSGRLQSGNFKLSQIICEHILNYHGDDCPRILIILTSCNPDNPTINKDTSERMIIRNMLAGRAKLKWAEAVQEHYKYIWEGAQREGGMCQNCNYIRSGISDTETDMSECEKRIAAMSESILNAAQDLVRIYYRH